MTKNLVKGAWYTVTTATTSVKRWFEMLREIGASIEFADTSDE